MENFEELIAEILEVDDVNIEDELDSFDAWDSLAVLSIIAISSSEYNVTLTADEIETSDTISGLKDLIQSKM
ncbi:MAG: phosphopantetheine-binding protein [Flavobacteriaceae bacterium]|nr:phosphopantetheine-binding protein [Flavobacteriaceae bacterium]